MTRRRIRVALIGTGYGAVHAKAYAAHPRAEMVAVAGRDPAKTRAFARRFGIPSAYSDYRRMLRLERPEAVSVVAPDALHERMTLDAFAAGCHVLCEKPIAPTVAAARRMVAASRKRRRQLMVNFPQRHDPCALAVKRIVESGRLGRLLHVRTRWIRPGKLQRPWRQRRKGRGSGILLDLGVHRLDLALWILGFPAPVSVIGSTSSAHPRSRSEDAASAFLEFRNGATLQLDLSWNGPDDEEERIRLDLFGTEGSVVHRNADATSYEAFYHGPRSTQPLGDAVFHPHRSVSAFVDALVAEREVPSPGIEAVESLRIIEAARASSRSDREILL